MIDGDTAPNGGQLSYARGIEVGHIFQLGDKYSKHMNCVVFNEKGKSTHPLMGCYGIGISRIVAAAIEQNNDESGIIWPDSITPFQISVISLNENLEDEVSKKAYEIYQQLSTYGLEVMLDDRDERAGVKFADADLIGIPKQLVLSKKGLKSQGIEFKVRGEKSNTSIPFGKLPDYFEKFSS
jgi:prolyl-tRNA synthetase